MSGFGHYDRTAAEVEDEIVTRGVLMDIDWSDRLAVKALAREAIDCTSEKRKAMLDDADETVRAKGELFALVVLMLDIMRQSAEAGVQTPDIGVWKVLGPALAEASGETLD
ncbi:MAG: hypothetical protein LBB76_00010 [Azoarcus sp.]|jgi:hypothetical protein|nr:hypothetical protein [Azoarcus sp.]